MTAAPRSLGPAEPIPLTVLTGFLGAGKTSLLNRLVSDPATHSKGCCATSTTAARSFAASSWRPRVSPIPRLCCRPRWRIPIS